MRSCAIHLRHFPRRCHGGWFFFSWSGGHLQPCGRVLSSIYGHHRDVWIIPSCRIWDYALHVEHVSCVITNCGQHQCHPLSSLNYSLDFAGGKYYQKITIPIFRLVLQNFAIPDCFPCILFYHYRFSFLSSGWFIIAVCGFISIIVNWCRVAISNEKST